jgi:phage gp46-like protein
VRRNDGAQKVNNDQIGLKIRGETLTAAVFCDRSIPYFWFEQNDRFFGGFLWDLIRVRSLTKILASKADIEATQIMNGLRDVNRVTEVPD